MADVTLSVATQPFQLWLRANQCVAYGCDILNLRNVEQQMLQWSAAMAHKNYCVISGVLFSLVALAHLLRLVYGMSVHVDEFVVPMFVSRVGFVVPVALAVWAFRLAGGKA